MALVIAAAIMIVDARKMLCFFRDVKKRWIDIARAIMIIVIGSKTEEMIFVAIVVVGFSVARIRL